MLGFLLRERIRREKKKMADNQGFTQEQKLFLEELFNTAFSNQEAKVEQILSRGKSAISDDEFNFGKKDESLPQFQRDALDALYELYAYIRITQFEHPSDWDKAMNGIIKKVRTIIQGIKS